MNGGPGGGMADVAAAVGETAVDTCDTSLLVDGKCAADGSSSYVVRSLTYADGKLSGTITTNGCLARPGISGMEPSPDCIEQVRTPRNSGEDRRHYM